jgi:cGMP-dependent protein kinase
MGGISSQNNNNEIVANEINDNETKNNNNNNNSHNNNNNKAPARKKEKIQIVSKNKQQKSSNLEKKVLELIHKNNPNKEDYDMIYSIISKHFFMQTLSDQAKNEIIITMSLHRVKKNLTLFKQGDTGTYWYIVHEGTFSLYINNEFKKNLIKGDSFGELALMNDAPRSATVKAETDCEVWTLKREVFRKILEFISNINYSQNMKFLNGIDIPLDKNIKSLLANNLLQEIYKKNNVIFTEGEYGNNMYIIKEGEVCCKKNGKFIRILKEGENFGQKAILFDNKRTMDIIAHTDCVLYSISVEFFKNQFGENYKEILYYSFINMAFKKNKYFNNINSKFLQKIFNKFTFKNFSHNEVIYKAGFQISKKIVIVLEGAIFNKDLNKFEAKRYEFLYPDSINNETEITLKQDLIAEPDCLLAEIDNNEIINILGGNLQSIQKKSETYKNIKNIALFKILSEDKLDNIQSKLNIEEFDNGRKIITQGEIGDKLFIIKSGRVDFFVNSKYVRSLNENEEFGARSLIISERRSATAIANGHVVCYTITANIFKSLLEPNLINYFQKKFYLEDNTIELKDLDNIKELGKGNFGAVNLVKSRKNKQLYAIKAQSLYQIKKEKLESCVDVEKNVLLKVDHPFIMKMVKYLKNENYIFFIEEYINGKELWEVIRDIGLLSKEQTQFYSASILLAIDYLHKKKIIYRDIKPENIMVTENNYIKVIDFGTVKEIKERTSTIIGTPHYMAPEIIKGNGYSFQVDIWSIAVCMYEFYCGGLPFGEDYDNPMDVYKAVAKEELIFPNFVKDQDFINLIRKMLKKNPTSRLWKFKAIKEEKYFNQFDWNKLISLSLVPPYKIKLKKDVNLNGNGYTYLQVLKDLDGKKYANEKKKMTQREKEFEKWLKNF